jgi:hypothetical protein
MFKRWCRSQNFTNATNLSHVLMDGGKLSVPFDRLNDFYEKYVEAVKSGEKLYVVEQKTETYNFFVDIDYKAPEPLGIDEIQDISKIICETVKRYSAQECIITVAMPRQCGDLMKTGIHMNWYGFVVSQGSANALRDYIIVALSRAKGGVDWSTVIDSSVYGSTKRKTKGSGFRMPWSHKMEGGVTHLPYVPLFRYTKEPFSALIRIDQEPTVEILKMATVRTDAPQTTIVEPLTSSPQEGGFTNDQTKDEVHDESLKNTIETFIRKHMDGQGDVYVTKIYKHKMMYLVSTTSRYCENIQRKHNSNHIWFIISGKIILQKCFCECPTLRGRRDGFCKDFCGRRHELPRTVVEKLYPEKEVCPEIKKSKVTQKTNTPNEVKPQLEAFINKFMRADENTTIVNMTKNRNTTILLTTSNYCETSQTRHDDKLMSYIITGNKIRQKCPSCRKNTSRTHILPSSVVKVLKQ